MQGPEAHPARRKSLENQSEQNQAMGRERRLAVERGGNSKASACRGRAGAKAWAQGNQDPRAAVIITITADPALGSVGCCFIMTP